MRSGRDGDELSKEKKAQKRKEDEQRRHAKQKGDRENGDQPPSHAQS